MKNIALIFPGQGAQKVGMGKELYDQVPAAKAVFEKANAVLGYDLTDIIFNGPEEKLMITSNCQPAIFTMSMAALAAFRASPAFNTVNVKFTAGLSLGEYGALCAAGVVTFEDSLKLIQQRGAFMDDAAKANPGKMAAVIGFDKDRLLAICREAGCEVANFNAPDQIVITGLADRVAKASELLAAAGCRKVIALDVSGAFHSSLMKPAAEKFSGALAGVAFKMGDIQVITNVTGKPQATAEDVRANLTRQIYSSVEWVESIQFLASQGITDIVEIGPGKVLKGLVRKIDPSLNVSNCQTPDDINSLTF
ncbi:MAG: ACP S-malonyltransferase [Candidatus Omnitrophica bacterium]|nr:ACP S-malonyltransferase [Candidatus Omnitrophota bacterium]